jgi:hypothetical protein
MHDSSAAAVGEASHKRCLRRMPRVTAGAWRYRDWVIHALNTDMPYDQFVQEQFVGE